jgi:hypothetical protein
MKNSAEAPGFPSAAIDEISYRLGAFAFSVYAPLVRPPSSGAHLALRIGEKSQSADDPVPLITNRYSVSLPRATRRLISHDKACVRFGFEPVEGTARFGQATSWKLECAEMKSC